MQKCSDTRGHILGVGEGYVDTILKFEAGEYHSLSNLMTKEAFSRMDAIIQHLPSVPLIQEEEIQECSACNVTYSHYHIHFEYGEGGYFSSKEPCEKC